MMNARLNKALVALLTVFAVGACDDPPVDPGSSDAARLATNPSFVVIEAGETRIVQAYLVNESGNPVSGDVDFEACNNLITVSADENQSELESGTNFVIQGNTLGESCVNVSAGGFDHTIPVRVVPDAIGTTAVSDTVRAGATGSIDVVLLNAAGASVGPFEETDATFSTSNDDALFFTDEVGSFDTHESDNVLVTVTYVSFGVTRTLAIPVVVLPAPAVDGEFDSNFGAIALGDTGSVQALLYDSIGNVNNLDMDIDSVVVQSSDEGVAVAWAEIVPDPDFEGRVLLMVYAEGTGSGNATITGSAYTNNAGVIDLGAATVTVLSPALVALTPNTGAPGTPVVISGTGLQVAGFTTTVFVNGVDVTRFVDSVTPTAISLDMPASPLTATPDIMVSVGGVESNELVWTQTGTSDFYSPLNEDPATAPPLTFPFDIVGTFVGANSEDFYSITLPASSSVTFRLDWDGGKDLDLLFLNSAATAYVCSFGGATAAHPEVATCTLPAGTYLVYPNDYDALAHGDPSLVTYELRGQINP